MPTGQETIEITPHVSPRTATRTNKDLYTRILPNIRIPKPIQILPPTDKIIIGSPTQIRDKTCTNLIHERCIQLDSTGIQPITEDIFFRRETKEIFRQYKMNKCREPSARETLTHAIIRGKQDNQMSINLEIH